MDGNAPTLSQSALQALADSQSDSAEPVESKTIALATRKETALADRTNARELALAIIFSRIGAGESILKICAEEGQPSQPTFWRWISADKAQFALYEQALTMRAHVFAEEITALADATDADYMTLPDGTRKLDPEAVARSKLRVNTRQWVLSRLLPKKYGERLELSGNSESPLTVVISAVQAKL